MIAPVRGKSRLNSLAWTLRRNVGGLALLFDPHALKEEDAGALYDEDTHELLMSTQEIASGTISDYLAHEIQHARNFHALTQGVDNLFLGWIANRETSQPFHSTYPHVFSIDELQAYAQQARVNILALDHRKPEADLEGTIEMLESGRQLASAAAATARRAATAIAAIAAAPAARRKLATTQEIDGVSTRVVGYRTARVTVYFHTSPLPERVVRPSPVMRSVVEFDDLTLQLITPAAFRPARLDEMLGRFLRRTQRLASRTEQIAEAFVDLQALVEQGEFTLARQRSDALRSLVRPR